MKLYELRIRDHRKDTVPDKFIVPIGDLLRCFDELNLNVTNREWEFYNFADGYGYKVSEVSDSLDEQSSVKLEAAYIRDELMSLKENFYDVYIKVVGEPIEFGVYDSTWLYVVSDRATIDKIAKCFENYEIFEWNRGWKGYLFK